MNIKDFALMLTGREYGHEINKDEEKLAKQLGFVVVFGASRIFHMRLLKSLRTEILIV